MREFLEIAGMTVSIIVSCVILLAMIFLGIWGICFTLNKSDCTVLINNEKVYEGPARYVYVSSVGENGNTKLVNLGRGFFGLITYKQYVSNNVEVK